MGNWVFLTADSLKAAEDYLRGEEPHLESHPQDVDFAAVKAEMKGRHMSTREEDISSYCIYPKFQ